MAKSRRALAEQLLGLQSKIAADLLKIDECKETLRGICEESGEGFTEEVAGRGTVEVKAASEPKFRGILPVLDPAAFLALPEKRRQALIENNIIAMTEQWSKATKPSVTVRL